MESRELKQHAPLLCNIFASGEGMKSDAISLFTRGRYWLELVKDAEAGIWKIKHWNLKSAWGQGDWSVVQPIHSSMSTRVAVGLAKRLSWLPWMTYRWSGLARREPGLDHGHVASSGK
jgi:hypothetical protein